MKAPCPRCRENGRDLSGDNLHIYPDGHAHSFLCDYHVKKYKENESKPKEFPMKLEEARTLPVRALRHKPISRDICERYGVRVAVSTEDGRTITEVFYPYTRKGEVIAYKVKSPGKPKKERYTWIGNTSESTLFGLNAV